MQCQPDETRIRSFYHHPVPYLWRAVKVLLISLPFFFVASFFLGTLDSATMMMIYVGIGAIFGLILLHDALLYFLDRIVVTNRRIVYVNWKNLFTREESEANLDDIQDIDTSEFGILSKIWLFDYGSFHVETAASKSAIIFEKAADPEGIKNFIYQLQRKSSSIMRAAIQLSKNDPTFTQNPETTDAASVGGKSGGGRVGDGKS